MTASRCGLVGLVLAAVLVLAVGFPGETSVWPPDVEQGPPPGEDPSSPLPELYLLRILAKDRIVADLALDRCRLLDAIALFRQLDRIPPAVNYPAGPPPDPPLELPSPTETERYCLWAITYARNSLSKSQPDRFEAVTRRLVAEFWAERRKHGEIRLPEAPSPESVHQLLERARDDSARGQPGKR
jgi:hypothetical protein